MTGGVTTQVCDTGDRFDDEKSPTRMLGVYTHCTSRTGTPSGVDPSRCRQGTWYHSLDRRRIY